jgi:hypothetical protein
MEPSAAALQLLAACDATRTDDVVEAGRRTLRAFRDAAPDLADAGFEAHVEALAGVLVHGADALRHVTAADAAALLHLAHRLCAPARATRHVASALSRLVVARPWPLHVVADLTADAARLVDSCIGDTVLHGTVDAPRDAGDLRVFVAALTAARAVLERGELPATLQLLLNSDTWHVVLAASEEAPLDVEFWRTVHPTVAAALRDAIVRGVCGHVDSVCRSIQSWEEEAEESEVPLDRRLWVASFVLGLKMVVGSRGEVNALAREGLAALVPPTAYCEHFMRHAPAEWRPRLFRLMRSVGFQLSEAAEAAEAAERDPLQQALRPVRLKSRRWR